MIGLAVFRLFLRHIIKIGKMSVEYVWKVTFSEAEDAMRSNTWHTKSILAGVQKMILTWINYEDNVAPIKDYN